MIFHENRLLADDSHVISYLIFVENWEGCLKKLPSAAVVIDALKVKLIGVSQLDKFDESTSNLRKFLSDIFKSNFNWSILSAHYEGAGNVTITDQPMAP